MKRILSLILLSAIVSASAVTAQVYREDGFKYLYDYDHRVVVRECIEAEEDYQDLWNGDYVRILGDYTYIYRDGRQVVSGNRIWLEHTGYYCVKRGSYYYLFDPDGDMTGVSGNDLYTLWDGAYAVKKGSMWYLYYTSGNRIGNAYSDEEITIYWNGYYCCHHGSYYYVYTPDGDMVSGIYSDEEPTLTNGGYFRCYRGSFSYLYDTDGRIIH